MYGQVLREYPDYTRWCGKTLTTGDPHRKLKRFAVWALEQYSLISAPSRKQPASAEHVAMEDEQE